MPTLGSNSYQVNVESNFFFEGKLWKVANDGTIAGVDATTLRRMVIQGLVSFVPKAANMTDIASPVGTETFAMVDGSKMTVPNLLAYLKTVLPVSLPAYRDAPATTLVTSTGGGLIRAPFAGTVTALRAALATVSSSGAVTIDVKKNGTSIMGANKLTIDVSAFTSVGSAVAITLGAGKVFADDDAFTVDVTAAGTGAKGLVVQIVATRA